MIKVVAGEGAKQCYVCDLAGGECFLFDGDVYMMTQWNDGTEYKTIVRCSDGFILRKLKQDRVTPIKTELKYWKEKQNG